MTVSPASGRPPAHLPSLRLRAGDAAAWTRKNGPLIGSNALAGVVASLLTIAYCLSFSALLFQGQLGSGLGPGLWALLVGSAIAGLYVSLTTSLPPAEAGPDNPAVAVLSVLAATVSAPGLRRRRRRRRWPSTTSCSPSPLATLVTGAVLYLLGRLKLGQYVRFIPYPVIGGFLAASGWFLIAGGIEVMTGTDLTLANLADAIPADRLPMLLLGAAFAITVYVLKARTGNTYVLPVAFIGGSLSLPRSGADLAVGLQNVIDHGQQHPQGMFTHRIAVAFRGIQAGNSFRFRIGYIDVLHAGAHPSDEPENRGAVKDFPVDREFTADDDPVTVADLLHQFLSRRPGEHLAPEPAFRESLRYQRVNGIDEQDLLHGGCKFSGLSLLFVI